ncbi:MAG TPA: TIR domain-containing protein [Ktedonobacteraceae bacterium]|nr:TIR domain-containing protein [Ktedonobacteraceae bacterium]
MNKQVFISYQHNDDDFAELLKLKIKDAGFDSWVDSEDLQAGEEWQVSIDQAIKGAFALIVIMTPEAQASEYVTYEWSFAWGAGVKVIPVMYKQTQLHPRLKTLQYLDFTSKPKPWDKLFDALKIAASAHSSSPTQTTQDFSPQIVEAAKLIVAAALAQAQEQASEAPTNKPIEEKETEKRISELITPKASQQLAGAKVLWVDDRPQLNTYERQALEQLGIQFTISTSTEDALEKLQGDNKYSVIISDMGRPPDKQAGYTLLEEIRKRGITIPFIIYAGSRAPEYVAETRRRGGLGTTNRPIELFEMVVDAIKAR